MVCVLCSSGIDRRAATSSGSLAPSRRNTHDLGFVVRFFGTFFPFLRAFERPMAIACLRLFTFPPLPPRPLFAVPFLKRRISLLTSLPELREYLRFLAAFFATAVFLLLV